MPSNASIKIMAVFNEAINEAKRTQEPSIITQDNFLGYRESEMTDHIPSMRYEIKPQLTPLELGQMIIMTRYLLTSFNSAPHYGWSIITNDLDISSKRLGCLVNPPDDNLPRLPLKPGFLDHIMEQTILPKSLEIMAWGEDDSAEAEAILAFEVAAIDQYNEAAARYGFDPMPNYELPLPMQEKPNGP